jgi:hypothetical protein
MQVLTPFEILKLEIPMHSITLYSKSYKIQAVCLRNALHFDEESAVTREFSED